MWDKDVDRRKVVKILGVGGAVGVAGCIEDEEPEPDTTPEEDDEPEEEADVPESTVLVDDVVDFELSEETDDFDGDFGFVTFRMHHAMVDGEDVYYIQTDVSDSDRASDEGLVHVPKLSELIDEDLTSRVYRFENGAEDQPDVMATEPGRDDYTPANRLYEVVWENEDEARVLSSVEEVEEAADDGEITVEETDAVYNLATVQWSEGHLDVDADDRSEYLGPGQLLEEPDTEEMEVRFKLHNCFPNTRYIVTDADFEPAAENMSVPHSPGLEGSTEAGATAKTLVFANGFEGPGPMGFQPSVFDFPAGAVEWSPYWTHWTYEWEDEDEARVLRSEQEINEAVDDGELIEHAGTPPSPDTFVVNCQVPVLADVTFEPEEQ